MQSPTRRLTRACALVVALAAFVVPFAHADTASAAVSIGAGLRGPSGLRATVYAKGLKHVSAVTTDARGRVWVATAAARDAGKDAVYLVTAAGATPQKVVTDVHTPLGILWVGDTLYVSQAHGVLALNAFDG